MSVENVIKNEDVKLYNLDRYATWFDLLESFALHVHHHLGALVCVGRCDAHTTINLTHDRWDQQRQNEKLVRWYHRLFQ